MYPSTFSSFNRPTTTDKLNNPSHSALHNTVSSAVGQIEAVIGTQSSAVGTIWYDLRAAASNGGGHVQTANKGGTGQTSYTKGDILAAINTSTLSKLAIGADGYVLRANSSVATGISWSQEANTLPKISISGSVIALTNSTAETSLVSITVPASTLGTNNAVRATLYIGNLNTSSLNDAVVLRANYGGSTFGAVTIGSIGGTTASISGTVAITLIANNSTTSQRAMLATNLTWPTGNQATSFIGRFAAAVPSINSGINQTLGITCQWNLTNVDNDINTNGYIVEKIA